MPVGPYMAEDYIMAVGYLFKALGLLSICNSRMGACSRGQFGDLWYVFGCNMKLGVELMLLDILY